ncbi:hypothetical protein NC652_000052 [Populus alba x Populus x berolinensis]|nr:hypothetical protein NC652_000052 [Populus alba x Populus x berolinensis]
MDVFIPEDYVMRRRKEKKGAAIAGKRQEEIKEEEVLKRKKLIHHRFDLRTSLLVAKGLSECRLVIIKVCLESRKCASINLCSLWVHSSVISFSEALFDSRDVQNNTITAAIIHE